MSFLLNRRKRYACFYEQSHLTKQNLETLSYPVLLVILAELPQGGDGSALLKAWCFPEPVMGMRIGRRRLPVRLPERTGSEPLLWE